jgi:hypothetical protein
MTAALRFLIDETRMRVARPSAARLTGALAILALCTTPITPAAAHTCAANYCSGSDSATATNTQGRGPQIYLGETGLYTADFYGSAGPCSAFGQHDQACFDPAAARAATARWQSGTGMGVQDYYFGGGAAAAAASRYSSPYCWGRAEGFEASYGAYDYFGRYYDQQWVMALDIEGYSAYGWSDAYPAQNRQVFNGFYDFVAGYASRDRRCSYLVNHAERQQPAVYSSPGMWSYAMATQGSIPNTYVWTYENCCASAWPGNFTGGNRAAFFGRSHYNWAWQFGQNPDYDVAYAPDYLPVFGYAVFR